MVDVAGENDRFANIITDPNALCHQCLENEAVRIFVGDKFFKGFFVKMYLRLIKPIFLNLQFLLFCEVVPFDALAQDFGCSV